MDGGRVLASWIDSINTGVPLTEDSKPPLLMKPDAAAARLGISRKQLLAEIRGGRMRFVLVGQRRYFTEDDLLNWIATKRQEAAAVPSRGRRTSRGSSSAPVIGFTDPQGPKRPR